MTDLRHPYRPTSRRVFHPQTADTWPEDDPGRANERGADGIYSTNWHLPPNLWRLYMGSRNHDFRISGCDM